MKRQTAWGLHWFGRDLRIPGNAALKENWKRHQGQTLGLFCFDSQFLQRADFSHNRFAFFMKTLKALKTDLQEQGGDLLVIDCSPQQAFSQLIDFFKKNDCPPALITWNRDYEPFARQRDTDIEELLKTLQIQTYHSRDHLLFEPDEILKSEKPGDFYQIYSPFARKWFAKLSGPIGESRLAEQRRTGDYFAKQNRKTNLFNLQWTEFTKFAAFPFQDSLERVEAENQKHVSIAIPDAGFFAAYSKLQEFKEKLTAYKSQRDYPAIQGTSRFSIYLKNGSLTTSQIISELKLGKIDWKEKSGPAQFLKELAWREFYYAILFHRPSVESKSYLPQFANIKWENDVNFFQRWKEGSTGFPIVDAGMRELAQTGWMHNRVRMIVASFLTKDLLIDWRWGENYFMKMLLDGDLAPNNGGWQWAASTGCDPQPYFRIFNPWLQSAKFDPQGSYIQRFVPELRHAPAEILHDPDADRSQWHYPAPMVNHSLQRQKALSLYKK